MATAVFFHAHPDDEAIITGGVMVKIAAAGHRVVLVTATDGGLGEFEAHHVPADSHLGEVREQELRDAAEVLGVHRIELLGYRDSGMDGEETNDDPACFWQAEVDHVAAVLADLLREEAAALLTIYDHRGGYGHPDHIQVHRVGVRAAAIAGLDAVYEATMNRDELRALGETDTELGMPASAITHAVDVTDVLDRKKRAMIAHRSQITEDSIFLTLGDAEFSAAFGTEWFIQRNRAGTGPDDPEAPDAGSDILSALLAGTP